MDIDGRVRRSLEETAVIALVPRLEATHVLRTGRAQGAPLVARVHQSRARSRQLPRERRIRFAGQGPEDWAKQVDASKALGASYLIAEPRNGGSKFRDGHLDVLHKFRETVRS